MLQGEGAGWFYARNGSYSSPTLSVIRVRVIYQLVIFFMFTTSSLLRFHAHCGPLRQVVKQMGDPTAAAELGVAPPSLPRQPHWVKTMELGYATGGDSSLDPENAVVGPGLTFACFKCGKETSELDGKHLSRCAKCSTVRYCSRECQVTDWKGGAGGGHKFLCAAYKRIGEAMTLTSADDKQSVCEEILRRVRFYACPYVVHKTATLGRGFLFLQSPSTLAELSLPLPRLPTGSPIAGQRSVLLHYLTMGEFDSELSRDDFEMAQVRNELKALVKAYNTRYDLVLLMRFRCGHVAVGSAPLVPDYAVCVSLGKDYYSEATEGALQLNLDDV